MDLEKVGAALANVTRLRVLQLLGEKPDSASGIHQRYLDTYEDEKRRESIYRGLERLVDADIATKEYVNEKGIIYRLEHDRLLIDLQNVTVETIDSNDHRGE